MVYRESDTPHLNGRGSNVPARANTVWKIATKILQGEQTRCDEDFSGSTTNADKRSVCSS